MNDSFIYITEQVNIYMYSVGFGVPVKGGPPEDNLLEGDTVIRRLSKGVTLI